jgi:hypothetical protein
MEHEQVTRSLCFDGHLKHGHGLCDHRSVTEEEPVPTSSLFVAATLVGALMLAIIALPVRRRQPFDACPPKGGVARAGLVPPRE